MQFRKDNGKKLTGKFQLMRHLAALFVFNLNPSIAFWRIKMPNSTTDSHRVVLPPVYDGIQER